MTQHTITPCILGTSQDQTMRGKETMVVGFFLEHTNESHHRQKKKKTQARKRRHRGLRKTATDHSDVYFDRRPC